MWDLINLEKFHLHRQGNLHLPALVSALTDLLAPAVLGDWVSSWFSQKGWQGQAGWLLAESPRGQAELQPSVLDGNASMYCPSPGRRWRVSGHSRGGHCSRPSAVLCWHFGVMLSKGLIFFKATFQGMIRPSNFKWNVGITGAGELTNRNSIEYLISRVHHQMYGEDRDKTSNRCVKGTNCLSLLGLLRAKANHPCQKRESLTWSTVLEMRRNV